MKQEMVDQLQVADTTRHFVLGLASNFSLRCIHTTMEPVDKLVELLKYEAMSE